MDVLKKYNERFGKKNCKFIYQPKKNEKVAGADLVTFNFDENVYVPDNWNFRDKSIQIPMALYKKVSSYRKLTEEIQEDLKMLRADFRTLVYGCNTFNQVAELWPPFENVRNDFTGTAVSVLSKDVVARVKGYKVVSKNDIS